MQRLLLNYLSYYFSLLFSVTPP